MSIPEFQVIDFPESGANVVVGQGDVADFLQASDKGYEYIRDAGAGFTADLEGSVGGNIWTVIVGLAASATGAVPAHFNYVRINCTVQGAKGATTQLVVGGKVL
jgi:hypothetical protein